MSNPILKQPSDFLLVLNKSKQNYNPHMIPPITAHQEVQTVRALDGAYALIQFYVEDEIMWIGGCLVTIEQIKCLKKYFNKIEKSEFKGAAAHIS